MGKYYSLERIKQIDAQYKILLGGRNIGKSYATKQDVVKCCYDHEKEFIYLRRWDEDIKTKNAINYFSDLNVKEITNGKYTDVYIYQNVIYLCNMNESGKPLEKYLIGRVHSLNQSERYKSQIFPRVDYVIFEEFITDKQYLNNEPEQLQEYVSTIFRGRVGVVYMVGNTISKLCPYFNEWKLEKVGKMKTHDIKLFENTIQILKPDGFEEIVIKIAVEMCGADSFLSRMAFGSSAEMITKNRWRSRSVPLLDKEVFENSTISYDVFVYCDNLAFRMSLMNYNDYIFWYVRPQTREVSHIEERRVISKNASYYPLHTSKFKGLNDAEQRAFALMQQGKLYYCSNSCGSDFEQVLRKYGVLTCV